MAFYRCNDAFVGEGVGSANSFTDKLKKRFHCYAKKVISVDTNPILRAIASVVGVLMLFFGFIGFFIASGAAASVISGRYYDQMPLYRIDGIAVDSNGNVHCGNFDYRSIQVYDSSGVFLYRFTVPFSGSVDFFAFYIDDEDVVHITDAVRARIVSFKDGYLVSDIMVADDSSYSDLLRGFSRYGRNQFFDASGNKYVVSGRTVRVYDIDGVFIRRVSPNAPIWPFTARAFWGFGAAGLIVIFFFNKKPILELVHDLKRT